jgi:hypothetical protein
VATDTYLNDLLAQALTDYPFIAKHDPQLAFGKGYGYAETYPPEETGKPLGNGKFSRPAELPMGRTGIAIHQPNKFSAADLAGEVLHVDPYAAEVRDKLLQSLTPEQLKKMQYHFLDYEQSVKEGLSPGKAMQNLGDAALRGYVLNQAPSKVNKEIGYTEEQKALFDSLTKYMKTPMAAPSTNLFYKDPFGDTTYPYGQ